MSINSNVSVSRSGRRKACGAAMGLVAACALVLVLIVVAFFYISMFIGGADEAKNASSAGTLNLGKHILTDDDFKVDPSTVSTTNQFQDVVDNKGKIGLSNINAVWGKVLLAEANAEEMYSMDQGGDSKSHADMMFSDANNINSELVSKLTDTTKQIPLFEHMASQNSVRMLGSDSKVVAAKGDNWVSSEMSRGEVSNLDVPANAILPTDSSYSALQLKNNRLPGYTPISINGHKFCFVSFPDKERTHLVSRAEFDENKSSAKAISVDWNKPVPNAFSCEGQAKNQQGYEEKAVAFVQANPQKIYKMSIPHGFLHIVLEDNDVTWLFNSPTPPVDAAAKKIVGNAPQQLQSAQKKLDGVDPEHFMIDHNGDGDADPLKVAMEQYDGSYAFRPDPQSKSGTPASAVCGTLVAEMVPLGKEYLPPCLDTALFGSKLDTGDYKYLEKMMVNRINQMISVPGTTFSTKDLHKLLQDAETAGWMQAEVHDYYIFSPDGKTIEVGTKERALMKCNWLASCIDHEPDGSNKTRAVLDSFFPLMPVVQVNVIPDPYCFPYFPPFGILYVQIKDKWQPGSGYDGCLGKITSKHHTDVYLYGVAGP